MPSPLPSSRGIAVLPHLLTILRVPLGAVLIATFDAARIERVLLAGMILAASAVSDALDGYLARRLGSVSLFGKWADPLADALFFLCVYAAFHLAGLMPVALVTVFAAREILQYAVIRPLTLRRGIDPGARPAGKIKTGLQNIGAAAVLTLCALAAAGRLERGVLTAASLAILATLVTVSVASLYWYVRPLLPRRRAP